MSIKNNFPSIRPSLSLHFAKTKKLDPRIDFTRASTGTYYDGETVAKAEENLITYSQSSANKGNLSLVFTSTTETAPDGTNTAFLLTENASGTEGPRLYSNNLSARSFISGFVYTVSGFFKAGTASSCYLSMRTSFSNTVSADFNLSTGAVNNTFSYGNFTNQSAEIINIGNGWYRCSLTGTAGQTVSNGFYFVGITTLGSGYSGGYPNIAMSGRNLYFWGAQLEQRDSVTAYTPTTDQPITRYQPVLLSAPANTARFDHDPVTAESEGLLIEEQRTNLLTYSEDFSSWVKTNLTHVENAIVAPDGTNSVTKVILNDGETTANSAKPVTLEIGKRYTYSIFIKSAGAPEAFIRIYGGDGFISRSSINFTFSDGSFTMNEGATSTVKVETLPNDWYRVLLTPEIAANVTGGFLYAHPRGFTGNGYSGIYIWGAQLEAGAFPTSYIKTEGSQVTRSADSASMTGENFSSWYRVDEGTLHVEAISGGTEIGNQTIAIFYSDNSNRMGLFRSLENLFTDAGLSVRNLGSDQALLGTGSGNWLSNQYKKISMSYKKNDFAISFHGNSALTDSSGIIPFVDEFYIGEFPTSSTSHFNGHIKKISYYPERLTNEQLQSLTKD